MRRSILKRLAEAEKKLAVRPEDIKEQKRLADNLTLLKSWSYLQKQREMSMTREEKQKDDIKAAEQVVDWYVAYQKLSPEEQKRQNEIQDLQMAEELEQFRAWYNSEERRQFDIKYAEKH